MTPLTPTEAALARAIAAAIIRELRLEDEAQAQASCHRGVTCGEEGHGATEPVPEARA